MKLRFTRIALGVTVLAALGMSGCTSKYNYETVPNDPLQARIYTLNNGLKVYMSVNRDEPRIQTYIAVRVGGKNDPAETTGLAHYFEHLMFKGTTHFGTQNYEAEKPLLDQIEQQFEVYRKTTDSLERKAIYHVIDSLSYAASQYAIPNEYDKLMAAIGANGTNAYTSYDVTCYTEDIPSNEIENWAKIRGEKHVADPRLPQGIRSHEHRTLPSPPVWHADSAGYAGTLEESFHYQHQELLQGVVCAQQHGHLSERRL